MDISQARRIAAKWKAASWCGVATGDLAAASKRVVRAPAHIPVETHLQKVTVAS